MINFLSWLVSSNGFMPHGHCYLWQPQTLWLNVGSDAMIASAYYAIPVGLFYLVRERRAEIPYPWILMMFAAFIFLCGTTHLLEIWTVWHPEYRIQGAVKLLTGLVSIATMYALFKLIPQAMQLRSPKQLQHEVELRTAELANVNSQLRQEITARDQAQRQLKEQDQRKDEFLATLAHELRNPLAPIRHAVKILQTESAEPQQRVLSRDVIARQAQRMALMLDDLLDVSRITRGRLELKKNKVELRTLVSSACETVRPTIEQKELSFEVNLPAEPLMLAVDPLRISQAISNLLTNAAKFTPAKGRVILTVSTKATGLQITVRDTGAGFDLAETAALFEMFSQAETGTQDAEGLGIGLSLVKALVELHGGTVGAHSQGAGLGAEFEILLPPSVIVPHDAGSEPSPSATQKVSPLKILVVDDNQDGAQLMGLSLEMSGHHVRIANSGRDALELAEQHRPDVIILDIGMPDMSGHEVAQIIRTKPWGKDIFLLAVTGWGQASDVEKARVAGFDKHLTKPVDPNVIDQLIKSLSEAKLVREKR
jgi:signal transduction histidine kinase/ActR/RegA family two-component response regulator